MAVINGQIDIVRANTYNQMLMLIYHIFFINRIKFDNKHYLGYSSYIYAHV